MVMSSLPKSFTKQISTKSYAVIKLDPVVIYVIYLHDGFVFFTGIHCCLDVLVTLHCNSVVYLFIFTG